MSKHRPTFVIGYLSGGQTMAGFTQALNGATAWYMQQKDGPHMLGVIPLISGPRIADARNNLVRKFLAIPQQPEWLLMVDDDMTFTHETIDRMFTTAHPTKAPIVGGLAFGSGRDGWFPNMYKLAELDDGRQTMIRAQGWDDDELVPVDATGAACLLIHRSVFEKVADEYGGPWPWFQETGYEDQTVGEDVTFCLRARNVGFPIVVDTAATFGHLKTVEVNERYYRDWVRNHRVLVTGTGRCGTRYMASVLASMGVDFGHEGVYSPHKPPQWPWHIRGEASWLAAPHLSTFDGFVVHLVRHPLDVIRSLVGIGLFDENLEDEVQRKLHDPYREYIYLHIGKGMTDPVGAASQLVLYWNRMIEPYANARIQIEHATPEDYATIARIAGGHHSFMDAATAISRLPERINARPRDESIGWDDIDPGLADQLLEQAKEYGYEKETPK